MPSHHQSEEWDLSCERGFTLLELMTVFGVLAVLMGVGIGFLSRSGNDMEIALAVVRDKVRLAHETARSTGRSTSVELVTRNDEDGKTLLTQSLRAKVLTTIGQWHLEPDERPFGGLVATLNAKDDPNGRYGHCARPDLEAGGAMFSVDSKGRSRFSMIDGFAVRLEVNLDARESCVLATFGDTFRLELDRDGQPMATMFLRAEQSDAKGARVQIDTRNSDLPLHTWVSLALEHDGRRLRLLVDGEVIGEALAKGEAFQNRRGDTFRVSPQDGPVPGRVDEIQLFAYERDELAELPVSVRISGLEQPLLYDRRGRLEKPATLEFQLEDDKRSYVIAPGGVLQ